MLFVAYLYNKGKSSDETRPNGGHPGGAGEFPFILHTILSQSGTTSTTSQHTESFIM